MNKAFSTINYTSCARKIFKTFRKVLYSLISGWPKDQEFKFEVKKKVVQLKKKVLTVPAFTPNMAAKDVVSMPLLSRISVITISSKIHKCLFGPFLFA